MAKQSMKNLIACAVMFSLVGVGLTGCSGCSSPVFSLPGCPNIPTPPSYYPPPAQRAPSTSMNFELDSQYITLLVGSLVQLPASASVGINVTQTKLSEQGTGNNVVNLLTVDFVPWEGNPTDQLGSADSPWQLDLTITPYLVNNQTVPNPANLMEILGNNANEGLVLRFDYSALRDATGADVTCVSSATTTDLNVYIRQSVLAGILSQLGSVSSIIFPTDKLAKIANDMTNVSPKMDVNGVNIGSDGSLKLGFAFSNLPSCNGCQPTAPFDPSPYYYPGAQPNENWDWNLDITQGFLTAVVQAQVQSQMNETFPGETPGVTSVVPSVVDPNVPNSGIGLTIYAEACGSCGCFNFSSAMTVTLQMSTDPKGDSVLQESHTKPSFDPGPGQLAKATCWEVDEGVSDVIYTIIGFINAFDVGTIIPPSVCPNVLGDPVELSAPPPSKDVLYGTSTFTAFGDLVILGRSKMLDQPPPIGFGVRDTVPPCTT